MTRKQVAALVVAGAICAYALAFWVGPIEHLLDPTSASAAEYVLLSRGVQSGERARQLLAGAWLAPSSVMGPRPSPPPANWTRPDFDDNTWTPLPISPPPSAHPGPPPPGGTLWVTASAGSKTPPPAPTMTTATPATGASGDGGLIFSDEQNADGGVRDASLPVDASTPSDGGVRDGGPPPLPPPCAGTLYLRRYFGVSAAALGRLSAGPSTLDLRIRYSDGFAAYLNGVEMVRRRLPDAAATEPSTLAFERGTVEPETHHLQVPPGLLLLENNLLAIEIHPRAAERCPRAELELIGSDGPRITRGPYIERLLDGALDLALETDTPTHLEVIYGKGEERRSRDRRVASTDDPAALPQTVHRVHLKGLRPGTAYHYQVTVVPTTAGTSRVELPLVSLHTPPGTLRPLRFIVYGDSRSGHAIHAQVVQAILDEDPDLILSIGDLVERGTEDSDWDRFFSVAGPLISRVPFFLAPGNHEYARRGQGAQKVYALWSKLFLPQPMPPAQAPLHVMATPRPTSDALGDTAPRGYYSFDVAGVHFVALDSNQLRNGEQLRWLETDLERVRPRHPRALIVFMHDGPYSTGWHGDNGTLIRDYVPILERHRVNVVFSGHDHDYERGRRGRLDYIVTGGGGAELRPLKCGVPGKKKCKHTPLAFYNEHNYVSVEVLPGALRLCAKRPDATPLEPCQLLKR